MNVAVISTEANDEETTVTDVQFFTDEHEANRAAVDRAVFLNLIDTDDEPAERHRLLGLFEEAGQYHVDGYGIVVWKEGVVRE